MELEQQQHPEAFIKHTMALWASDKMLGLLHSLNRRSSIKINSSLITLFKKQYNNITPAAIENNVKTKGIELRDRRRRIDGRTAARIAAGPAAPVAVGKAAAVAVGKAAAVVGVVAPAAAAGMGNRASPSPKRRKIQNETSLLRDASVRYYVFPPKNGLFLPWFHWKDLRDKFTDDKAGMDKRTNFLSKFFFAGCFWDDTVFLG